MSDAGIDDEDVAPETPMDLGPASPDRPRRRTAKKVVNYAKEQEFSDEDVFEDSPNDDEPEVRAPVRKKKAAARPRKPRATPAAKKTTAIQPAVTYAEDDDDVDVGPYDNRPIYTEKGYDPSLPPIRERFPFMPEHEEDGSPRIELIVGRRPVDDSNKEEEAAPTDETDGKAVGEEEEEPEVDDDVDEEEGEEQEGNQTPKRRGRGRGRGVKKASPAKDSKRGGGRGKKRDADSESPNTKKLAADAEKAASAGPVEYEYLVKYKGRSYLHLEWKTGADLESMNKSAKGIYRRWLKKLASGNHDEDFETPEFDPSFVIPEKIVDEAEQEITVELTDKELLRWEKQREKEMAEEDNEENNADEEEKEGEEKKGDNENQPSTSDTGAANEATKQNGESVSEEKKESHDPDDDWGDNEGELDFSTLSVEKLQAIINREGPYYPVVEGSDNPYRDGYAKEPPKKPRASYIFFQCALRSFYQKRHPRAMQSELMTMLGSKWQTLSEAEKKPFIQLANEEAKRFEKERALMEKAQRPTEVWQPLRRCRMVLERLAKDSFSEIFLEPVDLNEFPDYNEFIDSPMDLGTVRKRLESKKYQAPEQFARDMRKVWNNCKIYNQHGSAIWHVADYMSKQFERLYHAWVLEFRERYLRWSDPRARPWEHTCRVHDGKCGAKDSEMVLCDHCDAMYGIRCLKPPLKKVPTKAWHCPDCKPKLKSVKAARMLSAIAEHAARKRAELGDLPKKKVKQIMYLVKWAGLGYEFCTWETREDINNDELIEEFHRLNSSSPEEPEVTVEVIDKLLETTKHLNAENAGGLHCVPNLRAQLYAQTRAFQFAKFGMAMPEKVCAECGPKTNAVRCSTVKSSVAKYPKEVVECLTDLVFRVSRGDTANPIRGNTALPPPLTGEYDTILPVTAKGLMMNVGEIHSSVAFLGYRKLPDGSPGPAEAGNLIRNIGDCIIAVDGESTAGKSFKEVINMLRESGKNKYAYMRFLETKYSVCDSDLSSVGMKGRYAIEELFKKLAADRQRLVAQRSLESKELDVEQTKDDPLRGVKKKDDSDNDSDAEGSEGEFQPESDDDELVVNAKVSEVVSPSKPIKHPMNGDTADPVTEGGPTNSNEATLPQKESENLVSPNEESKEPEVNTEEKLTSESILYRQETTRSLGFRLLDLDLGYSSDEGGDDDCAYFLDGVDFTFTTKSQVEKISQSNAQIRAKGNNPEKSTVPLRQNEFTAQGDRAKLTAAVAVTCHEPCKDDFDNFPLPSTKEIEEARRLEEERQQALAASNPSKAQKRSTVKVEQLSISTGETIHVWANVEAAAATLQLPLHEIKQVLRGEYDEDIGDEVGGYRWRYALASAKVTAGNASSGRGGGGKKAQAAWLEFRDKLYDPNIPHSYKNGNRLRDYQVDGVNWLASTWYKKQGCILADEMGLGKTVQIVCYIEHLYRVEKIKRPYLIVVPLSTVEHWRREFEGWTDMVCCVYHDRQRVWRDVMREYEWYYEDRPHTPEFLKFDVLVTTYDTLIGDFDIISQIPFRVAVVDEAHRLRNQKGKLLECMREISAKGTIEHGFQSRVLMSGTPLQNDLTELWTLLNFIEPFKFPDLNHFQHNFGNMANREQVENLQKMISPYMLRRVKEDVAKDIPAKEETVIDVELTSIQKQYYRAIFEHNHAFLSLGQSRNVAPKLMNIQMELRKVCNHPFLLDGVEHRETERQFKEFLDKGLFEGKTPEEQQHMLNEHGYIMTSGKMVLLDKLLPKLRQEGHKILIFSQMVKMLDLISEYCELRNFRYERLDGRVRGTERQKSIDRFERDPESFLFLLSTRAGGVGINLTAADICIIFDSDWNPQNDVQAQARCHRIGQTKDVRIYRLVTSRSFEQEMFDRASRKLGLEQAVLGTFEKEREDDKPSQKEMEQLLKKGAYALLEDENDEITKEFCADDIESILAKRTRTRVVEGAKTSSWLNKQGMMVTKSKFSAEAGGAELDMDDPMFWQKVMPDFVTPAILLQKLNDLTNEIEGTPAKPKGRGRGRWKRKKEDEVDKPVVSSETMDQEAQVIKEEPKDDDDDSVNQLNPNETQDEHDEEAESKTAKNQLKRSSVRKVHTFMSDLKAMLEDLFEDADDNTMTSDDRATCQKLLLTISVKEKIFNEEHRLLAKRFLKRLEGDRRRRCRTSEQPRFVPGNEDEPDAIIPQLMIKKKERKKRRKRGEIDEVTPKRRKKRLDSGEIANDDNGKGYVGEDGYLHHSDSEADWSDVGEDLYQSTLKRKEGISRKEAHRRRQWAADDDAATAAGRPWPVFPRHVVTKVLTTILDEVIKYDQSKGGIFSVPVPKDEFPEYYEQIEKPMDYGTMKAKLDNGEYRSAQQMQKDFILILQNCRKFNAATSEIVKEARQQHLLRPVILKQAAMKHDLFLSEDGTVLEIFDDEKGGEKKKKKDQKGKSLNVAADDDVSEEEVVQKEKRRKGRKSEGSTVDHTGVDDGKRKLKGRKPKVVNAKDDDVDFTIKSKGRKRKEEADDSAPPEKAGNGLKPIAQFDEIEGDKDLGPQSQSKGRKRASEFDENDGVKSGNETNNGKGRKRKTEVSEDPDECETDENIDDLKIPKKGKKKNVVKDEGAEKTTETDGSAKKSRIKIKVKAYEKSKDELNSTQKRKIPKRKKSFEGTDDAFEENTKESKTPKKRKQTTAEDAELENHDDAEDVHVPRKKKRKIAEKEIADDTGVRKKRETRSTRRDSGDVSPSIGDADADADEPMIENEEEGETPDNLFLNPEFWKARRENLDGSFEAARKNLISFGPWKLPKGVAEKQFIEIAKATLTKMDRHDRYSVFTEPVSDDEAPGYSEVVKNPMDFGTMKKKVSKGEYGTGSRGAAALYKDFVLVFDNCRLYNPEDSDVVEEAARVLSFLPEAYVTSCVVASRKGLK